ncbi:hypothetical protein [Gilvimarinus polysaccharolyticus]|uniref:hypothetical protein n=1 Tax=Gilvimarinus polysaccharolyticus TaxID=863921 RepID=UPI00067352FA|nr:hypothetical protein [Gilvimarinus polysaccharolyticus]
MHTPSHSPGSSSAVVESFLREAKRLQRAACSGDLADCLPVLRRLIAQQVFTGVTLPQLRRRQDFVQRKHTLQLLALEAGYISWAECRRALEALSTERAEQYNIALRYAGYPNHWFSSLQEARAFAFQHGGYPLAYGRQGVVIPAGHHSH